MIYGVYISGWWLTYPCEKYDFVSWDDEIANIWKHKHVPNHQSVFVCFPSNMEGSFSSSL